MKILAKEMVRSRSGEVQDASALSRIAVWVFDVLWNCRPSPLRVPVVVTLCRAAPTWQVRSKKAKERMMTSKAQMNSIIMQRQENLGA